MNIKKALVVDDSKVAHLTLRKMLMERNIEIDWAGSGEDCLVYLKTQKPDIIFMDVMMPGMDGFETAGAISNDSNIDAPPIVMCSANATDEDKDNARKNGAVDFLSKPYTPQELDQIIARVQTLSAKVPAPAPQAAASEPAMDKAEMTRFIEQTAEHAAQTIAEKVARDIAADVAAKAAAAADNAVTRDTGDVAAIAEKTARQVAEQVAHEANMAQAAAPRDNGAPNIEQIRKELTRGLEAQVTLHVQDTLERSMAAEEFRQQIVQIVQDSAMPAVKSAAKEAAAQVAQQSAKQAAEEATRSLSAGGDGGLKRANIAMSIGLIALIVAAVGVAQSFL